LAVALRSIISQRLIRKPDNVRVPAVEILMNTRHIADLIERGDINEVKQAMEQSLAPGCQTFEQHLYELYSDRVISLEEALANADSPTNLHWLINNAPSNANEPSASSQPPSLLAFDKDTADGASFQEFTLHVDDN
ncbi:MAG: type IV pili twitching motility protein PilT, partial [Thauera sp.]|nr:type IV pili twitching motility protein PilT [Thauera sp.]